MLKDARDYQILFLGLFLMLGLATRDWTLRLEGIAVAIVTALATQAALTWITQSGWPLARIGASLPWSSLSEPEPSEEIPARPFNWRSPLITALGLTLLLRVDHLPTLAMAAALAIASKFALRTDSKHFFNPANFGIIAALTLTQDAWVSPGQWGEEIWYGLIFFGAGGLVLKRVGRWDTTVAFLGSYALLEALRNLYLGWTWDVWTHRLMSGSLLLFALFMVTDPRSIPNARPARLLWAVAIALLTFVLRNYCFLPTAVFWALFIVSPTTVLLDRLWQARPFEWRSLRLRQQQSWISG